MLLALAAAVFWWINREAMDNRLRTAEMLAQDVADHLDSTSGTIVISHNIDDIVQKRLQFFKFGPGLCVIVTDKDRKFLYSNEPMKQADLHKKLNNSLDKSRLTGFKAVTAPIVYNGGKIGQVSLLYPSESLMQRPEVKWVLGLLLVSLTALGWLMIYLLSSWRVLFARWRRPPARSASGITISD